MLAGAKHFQIIHLHLYNAFLVLLMIQNTFNYTFMQDFIL